MFIYIHSKQFEMHVYVHELQKNVEDIVKQLVDIRIELKKYAN